MTVLDVLFYLFSFILVCSGIATVSVRHPVHAVLWLIVAFFNAAVLLVMIGAEYIAMMLVVVYVGAVIVLFLFVTMMLNIRIAERMHGIRRHMLVGGVVACILIAELLLSFKMSSVAVPNAKEPTLTNAESIGMVLYTDYLFPFQLSGVILLVAMVSVITLAMYHAPIMRQNICDQVKRRRDESVELVNVKSGEGVKKI